MSVGIMASSVVSSTFTDVLLEPFNNLTAWSTLAGTPSIVTGRTGTAASLTGSVDQVGYTIPAAYESDVLTIGFALRTSSIAAGRRFFELWSDTGTRIHNTVETDGLGRLVVRRSGTTIAQSASGLIAANTWYYIEIQIRLHDTAGTVVARINGTEVLNLTGLDTRNIGTKSVYDQVRLVPPGTGTNLIDDLYVTMGAGAPFKGDITIP